MSSIFNIIQTHSVARFKAEIETNAG